MAPRSMEENQEVMDLMAKHHSATCFNADVDNAQNKGRALWLGLKNFKSRLVPAYRAYRNNTQLLLEWNRLEKIYTFYSGP